MIFGSRNNVCFNFRGTIEDIDTRMARIPCHNSILLLSKGKGRMKEKDVSAATSIQAGSWNNRTKACLREKLSFRLSLLWSARIKAQRLINHGFQRPPT